MGAGKVRIDLQGLEVMIRGLLKPVLPGQCQTQGSMGDLVVGLDPQRLGKAPERPVRVAFLDEGVSEEPVTDIVVCHRRGRMVKEGDAVFPVPQLHPGADRQCCDHHPCRDGEDDPG